MLLTLFITFFKIGLFTIGGGYAMIPLIEREVVERKGWISREDFLDLLAIAQSAPGVFAVNISIFIGYRMRKSIGSIFCALGTVLPSIIIILAIALLMAGVSYYGYRQHGWFVTWLPIPTPPPAAAPGIIDTVTFGDAKLTAALREAAGGGMITTETLEQVTKLKLEELPENLSELKEKVPNLTTLILPQEAAKDALEATDGQYTIVLAPEGEAAQ